MFEFSIFLQVNLRAVTFARICEEPGIWAKLELRLMT